MTVTADNPVTWVVDPEALSVSAVPRRPDWSEADVDAELERRAFEALMAAEQARLAAIGRGERPDILDDGEWSA